MRWVLASLSLAMLMPSLDTSIANAALPTLAKAFNASFQETQWIVLSYLLAVTTLIVSAGRLGDAFGRKRMLLVGLLLFTAASLLCGLAPSLWSLLVARSVQGIGAAMTMGLAMALVGDTVPNDQTGRAMGWLGTMSAAGTTIGPSLGGLVIAGFGWRAMFLLSVPLGFTTMFLAQRYLPTDRHLPADGDPSVTSRAPFDVAGSAALASTLALYALAMTLGRGSFGFTNVLFLAMAALSVGLLIAIETRTAAPVIRPAMLRDPNLRRSLLISLVVSAVVMSSLVVGPFYLSGALGLSTVSVGIALSIGPLAAALSGVPAGRLVDRLGSPRMTTIGLAGMASGTTLLAAVSPTLGVVAYVAPIACVTAGYAVVQAANNTALMTTTTPDQLGIVAGMLTLSRNLGLITGASLMGAVFTLGTVSVDGAAAHRDAVVAGTRATFGLAAVLTMAMLATVVRTKTIARRSL